MTYEEVHLLYDRLKSFAIGTPVKGRLIQSLSIGPTDWEQMTDYINKQIQDGPGAAIEAFSGRSFSVYGINKDDSGRVPKQTLILLDDWEKLRSN